MDSPDQYLAWIARQQHGVFTIDQTRAAGFTDAQARRRVARGQWVRITRGVFALNGLPPSTERRAMMAQLSRPGSAVSHLTAANLLGAAQAAPPRPSLTVPRNTSGASPIARIHRLDLPPTLACEIRGIPCTTAARTIVDCATILGPKRLGDLIDDLLHRRLTTAREVIDLFVVSRHVTHARRSAAIEHLEVWLPAIRPGSAAEARFLRQVEEWGLPAPERQIRVVDRSGTVIARLDGGWTDRRLGFEYDSVQWHGPAAWASDEARHQLLVDLGWRIVHVDKADLGPGARHTRERLISEYHRRPTPTLART